MSEKVPSTNDVCFKHLTSELSVELICCFSCKVAFFLLLSLLYREEVLLLVYAL